MNPARGKVPYVFLVVFIAIFMYEIGQNTRNNPQRVPSENYLVEGSIIEDIEPLNFIEEEMEADRNGVYVPHYWEGNTEVEERDYLKGFYPGIKEFKEYWNRYYEVIHGKKYEQIPVPVKDLAILNLTDNVRRVIGIKNESSFFEWEEGCSNIFLDGVDTKVWVCPNWINWFGIPIEEKDFVLVDCYLEGEGLCLFEDYLPSYYRSKKEGENRCFGENSEYLCILEEYLLEIDNI